MRSKNSIQHKYADLSKKNIVDKRPKHTGRSNIIFNAKNDALITLPQKYLDIPRVKSDIAMIFSDIHLPFIDWDLFFQLMGVAKTQNVKTCIIGGDLFDYKQFSTFPDAKADRSDEMTMAETSALKFFNKILEVFEQIYVICGNHDFRIVKWSQGLLSERQFFRFLSHITDKEKRVHFSAYQHLIL